MLGLVTIVGVVLTWMRGSRIAARVVAGARVVSVLLIAPVFLLQGLESWILLLAAGLVILNITTVILVLSRPATAEA